MIAFPNHPKQNANPKPPPAGQRVRHKRTFAEALAGSMPAIEEGLEATNILLQQSGAEAGRASIYLAFLIPGTRRPTNPDELPAGVMAMFCLIPSISLSVAQRFCRRYNQQQLQLGLGDDRWAVLAVRPEQLDRCPAEDALVDELLHLRADLFQPARIELACRCDAGAHQHRDPERRTVPPNRVACPRDVKRRVSMEPAIPSSMPTRGGAA